ncbi:MAG: hypothetical protein EOP07_21625 [Proteobacteria bacterium]|nr:MAG: hypothetical protein EOP07_21625 [Pseudomonadota bacterium]
MKKSRNSLILTTILTSLLVMQACGRRSDAEKAEPADSSEEQSTPMAPANNSDGLTAAPIVPSAPIVPPVLPLPPVVVPSPAPIPTPEVKRFSEVSEKILKPLCSRCHTPPRLSGGIDLSTYASVISNIDAIKNAALVEQFMPPSGPLKAEPAALLKLWIDQGAAE